MTDMLFPIKIFHTGPEVSILPTYYVPILVLFIVVFILLKRNKHIIAKKIVSKKNKEKRTQMVELAKRFIDKECLAYSFDGHQYEGVIKEVTEGAILIEKNGAIEALNLDFIIRIREFPKNKKGKKKSIVLD